MCIMKYLAILCPYLLSIQPKLQSHSCQHSPLSLQFPRRWGFEEASSYYWAGPGGEMQILLQSDLLMAQSSESSAYNILMFWCKETIVILQWAKVIDIKADRGEWEAMTVEEVDWGGRTKSTPDLGQAEDFKVLRSWMCPPTGQWTD